MTYQCWKIFKILLIYFSLEADIRTAKISRLSTQLRRQLHQLRRTLRTHHYHHKDLVASGSVLVKAVSRNSSACVDSLFENSKKSRKTRWDLSCHLAISFSGQRGWIHSTFHRAQPWRCLYNGNLSLSLSHLFVAEVSSKFHFVKCLKTNTRM